MVLPTDTDKTPVASEDAKTPSSDGSVSEAKNPILASFEIYVHMILYKIILNYIILYRII